MARQNVPDLKLPAGRKDWQRGRSVEWALSLERELGMKRYKVAELFGIAPDTLTRAVKRWHRQAAAQGDK